MHINVYGKTKNNKIHIKQNEMLVNINKTYIKIIITKL